MRISKQLLWWVIGILVAINLSIIGTIIYRVQKEKKVVENSVGPNRFADRQLGQCFREELQLSDEQHEQFRTFRHHFHEEAGVLTQKMHMKRMDFMSELGKEESDTAYLHQLATEIGQMHAELKYLTFEYYLEMKRICSPEQQKQLFRVFNMMMDKGPGMEGPPGSGHPGRKGRMRK